MQTSIDGNQAIIPMILTSDDPLMRTQSSDQSLMNKSSLSNNGEEVRKQTVLSRQGGRAIHQRVEGMNYQNIEHSLFENITSTGRTGTINLSQNVRMLPKGLQKQESSDEYSFESTKRQLMNYARTFHQQPIQHAHTQYGQDFFKSMKPTSTTNDQNQRLESPILNRWSSRREGEQRGTSLTDILITDQNAKGGRGSGFNSGGMLSRNLYEGQKNGNKKPKSIGQTKPNTAQVNHAQKSRNIYRKVGYTSAATHYPQLKVQAILNFEFEQIPDFEEQKTKMIVDTYKRILNKQSTAEGRSQKVIVQYNDEKFFFDSGINQPLFIGHLKKNPGFDVKEQLKSQNIINKRSCVNFKINKTLKELKKEQQSQVILSKYYQDALRSYLNSQANTTAYQDFNGGTSTLGLSPGPINNNNLDMHTWSNEVSPTQPPTNFEHFSENSPYRAYQQYRSPKQHKGKDSQNQSIDFALQGNLDLMSEGGSRIESRNQSHGHSRDITLSAYPIINGGNSPSKQQNKIIYSINKSTRNQNSVLRSKHGQINEQHSSIMKASVESKQVNLQKSLEYRNLEGVMNVKALQNNRSTISSHQNLNRQLDFAQPGESAANSSILASQEHLEPRPQLAQMSLKIDNKSQSSNIAMQRVELKLNMKQSIEDFNVDDERVILRESRQTIKRDYIQGSHHKKKNQLQIRRGSSGKDDSARKRYNQDLAGIQIPAKDSLIFEIHNMNTEVRQEGDEDNNHEDFNFTHIQIKVDSKFQKSQSGFGLNDQVQYEDNINQQVQMPQSHSLESIQQRISLAKGTRYKTVNSMSARNHLRKQPQNNTKMKNPNVQGQDITIFSAVPQEVSLVRFATIKTQRAKQLTTLLKAKSKSVKSQLFEQVYQLELQQLAGKELQISERGVNSPQNLKQLSMAASKNIQQDGPIVINILESNYEKEHIKAIDKNQINQNSEPSQDTLNNNQLLPPNAELPDLIKRSSRNVMSKLQGRSLTASMRSCNTKSQGAINQPEQSFSSVVQADQNMQDQDPLILRQNNTHERALSQVKPSMIIQDHNTISSPSNEDQLKRSVITGNDEDSNMLIQNNQRKSSIEMSAHYKKDSSIIDEQEGYLAATLNSEGKSDQMLQPPIIQKQVSQQQTQEVRRSNTHIIPSMPLGRRRSSANKDLPNMINPQNTSAEQVLNTGQSPKRTVVIRKSNGQNEQVINNSTYEKSSQSNQGKSNPQRYLKRTKTGRPLNKVEIVPLDNLKPSELNVYSNQIHDFKQARLTDLKMHGRAAPSVYRRNLQKMQCAKQDSRNGMSTQSAGFVITHNATFYGQPKDNYLSATFHVMPITNSRQGPTLTHQNFQKPLTGNQFKRSTTKSPLTRQSFYPHTATVQELVIQHSKLAIDAHQQRQQLELIKAYQSSQQQLTLQQPPEITSNQDIIEHIGNTHLKIPLPQFTLPIAQSNVSGVNIPLQKPQETEGKLPQIEEKLQNNTISDYKMPPTRNMLIKDSAATPTLILQETDEVKKLRGSVSSVKTKLYKSSARKMDVSYRGENNNNDYGDYQISVIGQHLTSKSAKILEEQTSHQQL